MSRKLAAAVLPNSVLRGGQGVEGVHAVATPGRAG